jgi:ABC-type glycerol-3-phosphate transport system substrate-binding protein
MTLGGTYEWPVISEDSGWETEEEMARHLGFVAAPTPTPDAVPVVSLGGTSWAVLRQSEHYDLVLELLRIVVEPEVIQPFCEQELQISTLVPVNQRLVQGDHPWMKKIVPLLSLARPRPMIAEYIQVSRFVQQMFERILCEGAPIDAVVERTAQTLELLLGEQAR